MLLPQRGWTFDFRPEIHVDDNIMVADFAGWRAARRVQPREEAPMCERSEHSYAVNPDWVCEIIAPTSESLIRRIKMPAYHWMGVSWFWILDAVANRLEVHFATQNDWELWGTLSGGVVHARPLEHLPVSLWNRDEHRLMTGDI